MYKKLLTKPTEKLIEKDEIQFKATQSLNVHLKFQEILCPKTEKSLVSSECSKCMHKKEYQRKHDLGLTLSTTICTWVEAE
ncbi:MAG: hypothetical protein FK733_16560 [Asgard group archaeon]|nr:hypothetical protein [Asgard group archaeon]